MLTVKTPEEIFEILEHSIAKRVTAETMCNGQSSRSHSIFTLNVHVKERANGSLTGSTRIGRLNLVDLSGSENRKRAGDSTGAAHLRQRESSAINQGLLSLGRVIKARTEGGEHVPFRDSKLTRILEESLGGNCITTLILTISPNHKEVGETLSTLNYAHKAKVIENRVTKNVRIDPKSSDDENSDEDSDNESNEGSNGKNGKGQNKNTNKYGMHDDDLNSNGLKRTTMMPWSGRVPVRRSTSNTNTNRDGNQGRDRDGNQRNGNQRNGNRNVSSYVPRHEPNAGEGKMLHAPSVEWVKTNLLCSTPDNPFGDVSIDKMDPGKYSKRRRSNVAVIIVRIVFISSFLFYCLLFNHSFQTNPNKITNCFQLFSLFTTYYIAPALLFDF